MKKHIYKTQIRERQLDSFGHVNNAQYMILFEEARWEMITSRGYGIEAVHENKIGTVILSCSIQFKRELKLRDWIQIETEFVSLEGRWVTLRHRILKEDGKVATEAEFKMGCFDLRERKLVPPTALWLSAISGKSSG